MISSQRRPSEVFDRCRAYRRPFVEGPRNHRVLVLQVFFEDRRVDKKIELAIDDVRIAHVAIEFLAGIDAESSEASELRQEGLWGGVEAFFGFGSGKIVIDAVMRRRVNRVADLWCVAIEHGHRIDAMHPERVAGQGETIGNVVLVSRENPGSE